MRFYIAVCFVSLTFAFNNLPRTSTTSDGENGVECVHYSRSQNSLFTITTLCNQWFPSFIQVTQDGFVVRVVLDETGNVIHCVVASKDAAVKSFLGRANEVLHTRKFEVLSPLPGRKNKIQSSDVTSRLPPFLEKYVTFEKILDKCNDKDELLKSRRKREAGEILMWPGSKWCGHGSTAAHAEDYGEVPDMDRCCKQHDQCPYIVEGFTTKYGYFNWQIHTLNHCDCDKQFEVCLKSITENATAANFLGRFYFNFVNRKCFTLQLKKICTEYNWWAECIKRELKWSAVLQPTNATF